MFRGVALQFFIAVGVNVDTARLKGTLGENNLVGGGAISTGVQLGAWVRIFLAAPYNTIQLGGGGWRGSGGKRFIHRGSAGARIFLPRCIPRFIG